MRNIMIAVCFLLPLNMAWADSNGVIAANPVKDWAPNVVAAPLPSNPAGSAAKYEVDRSNWVDADTAKFRSNYDIKYWDEYDNAKSEAERSSLITRLDQDARRYEIMRKSWLGTALGYLADPIVIAIGVGIFLLARRHKKTQKTQAPIRSH